MSLSWAHPDGFIYVTGNVVPLDWQRAKKPSVVADPALTACLSPQASSIVTDFPWYMDFSHRLSHLKLLVVVEPLVYLDTTVKADIVPNHDINRLHFLLMTLLLSLKQNIS